MTIKMRVPSSDGRQTASPIKMKISESDVAIKLQKCPACGEKKKYRTDVKTCGCGGTNPFSGIVAAKKLTPENAVDINLQKLKDKREGKDGQIKTLTERVASLEAENEVFNALRGAIPQVVHIEPKVGSGKSESAMVIVWSDWHIEETVRPEQVGGKNEYSLAVADKRFKNLLYGGMAWYKINSAATGIKTIVLALLGDFISGSIHADLAEGNSLPPADAIYKAYSMIVSGIKFMLENTPREVSFVLPCHSGNHGRMTKEQRISTESGNSLEYFMYLMLQDYFEKEKRVKFVVQAGYHSYVSFFEGAYETRFHHGHQMNYQGGVGGLTVPVNKSIAQWNKSRSVNLDIFGHFHTSFDGGNFVSNGSLIGLSPYGVSIKASYEPASQQCFLINREYGAKTMVAPIFVGDTV